MSVGERSAKRESNFCVGMYHFEFNELSNEMGKHLRMILHSACKLIFLFVNSDVRRLGHVRCHISVNHCNTC